MGYFISLIKQYKWIVTAVAGASILLIFYLLSDSERDYYRDEIEKTNEVDSVISLLDKLPSGKFESVGYDKAAHLMANHSLKL